MASSSHQKRAERALAAATVVHATLSGLPQHVFLLLTHMCDAHTLAALTRVCVGIHAQMQEPGMWMRRLEALPAYHAARLAAGVEARLATPPPPTLTRTHTCAHAQLFFSLMRAHEDAAAYRFSRELDALDRLEVLAPLAELNRAASAPASHGGVEACVSPSTHKSTRSPLLGPAAGPLSGVGRGPLSLRGSPQLQARASPLARALASHMPLLSLEEQAVAAAFHEHAIAAAEQADADDRGAARSGRRTPQPSAPERGSGTSPAVPGSRRMSLSDPSTATQKASVARSIVSALTQLVPVRGAVPCHGTTASRANQAHRHTRHSRKVEAAACEALRACTHGAQVRSDERAGAELLVDMLVEDAHIQQEVATADTASVAVAPRSAPEHPGESGTAFVHPMRATGRVSSPLYVANSLPLLRTIKGTALATESRRLAPNGDSELAVSVQGASTCMAFSGVLGGKASALIAPIKATAMHGEKIVVADRAGTLRVHARTGEKLASGRAARSTGFTLIVRAAPSVTGLDMFEGRCCSALCSVDMHDDVIATGHPDGTVILSTMGAGHAMRATGSFPIDEALVRSSSATSATYARARSGSSGASAHTVVAFADEGDQLVVARKMHRAAGVLRSAGSVLVYAACTGDVTRTLPTASDIPGAADLAAVGLASSLPTTVRVSGSHTVCVGHSDGCVRVWDLRSSRPVATLRAVSDPVRSTRAAKNAYWASIGSLRGPPFHAAGATCSVEPRVPDDSECAIQHIDICDNILVESRATPLDPIIGDPLSPFMPLSSPFVRVWDMRRATGGAAHVIDLGPSCIRAVAGVHVSPSRVLIAHQHVLPPLSLLQAAGGDDPEPADVPQFHWNARDRERGPVDGGDGSHPVAEASSTAPARRKRSPSSRLWWHLLQSDLYIPYIPRYAWPHLHTPPAPRVPTAAASNDSDGSHAHESELAALEFSKLYGAVDIVRTERASTGSAGTTSTASEREADSTDDDDPDASESLRRRRAVAMRDTPMEMSALSSWHPSLFTNTGYTPLPSVTCLAADAGSTVVGTDEGALLWRSMAAGSSLTGVPSTSSAPTTMSSSASRHSTATAPLPAPRGAAAVKESPRGGPSPAPQSHGRRGSAPRTNGAASGKARSRRESRRGKGRGAGSGSSDDDGEARDRRRGGSDTESEHGEKLEFE